MRDDTPKRPYAATRQALAEAMAEIDGVLPGSVVVRHTRCGKPNCACTADPPALHGPYLQWTRTEHGKTVTRLLTEQELTRYQPWFDNSRRLKDLIAKLEIASLHAVAAEQADKRPERDHGPPSPRTSRRQTPTKQAQSP